MPSSLPLLHTAMPTPYLNAFWHSDPYICLHFLGIVLLHVGVTNTSTDHIAMAEGCHCQLPSPPPFSTSLNSTENFSMWAHH